VFLLIFLIGLLIIKIIRSVILYKLNKWAERTATTLDDFLLRIFEKKLIPVLYLLVFYLALKTLTLTEATQKAFLYIVASIATFYGIRLLIDLINYSLERYWIRKTKEEAKKQSIKGLSTLIKIIVWTVGIVFLLDNLGFKISTVVAGLGIGGIAVALAAQTILGDLFNYFVIFFDKPFEVGDFIIIDNHLGTVEHIGIKTTRIRSLGGEQLIFSNTDLTNSRIRNYKRMQRRRVVFKIGVIYQTTLEQLKEIPGIIRRVIESIPDTVFDRAHFFSYGDFSLDFEIVYYVLSNDYNKYMDIQQEINFKIKEEFEKRGIEFAYPTQTLYIERAPETGSA
jgi:small-conductance mechanosensitive channel